VGAVQVGTYDQLCTTYKGYGIVHPVTNVFCAAMTSGLLYATITMPLETCKNRTVASVGERAAVRGFRPA